MSHPKDPSSKLNVPARQSSQVVDFAAEANLPVEHLLHFSDEGEEEYQPGGQSVQAIAMSGEYVPLGQDSHWGAPVAAL